MNDYDSKMSVMKEIYDGALKSRGKKKFKPGMKEKADFDMGADEFDGLEEKPMLTITLISGDGLPKSDMLDEANAEAKKTEEEDEEERKELELV
jgi:hypothetical protein